MAPRWAAVACFFVTSSVFRAANVPDLLQYHKDAFEKTFHDRCDKYPFVQQYVNKLVNSDERYLTFVYQENGLKNGGLGDKLGGLVSAVAMALRFNRTLILRSSNDMHEVFRPYHPTDIHSPIPKYSWTNITTWSHYDWKYANADATEYDLYDCINNTGQKNSHCSMKDGDAGTPHILYRSNRAYLCYYDNNKDSVAYQQMSNILGVGSTSDLYEVAGCMLRLALWPTEHLWEEVGKQFKEFQATLGVAPTARRMKERNLLRTRRADEEQSGTPNSVPAVTAPEPSVTSVGGTTGITSVLSTQKVVQVGMHFRCGDKSYIKRGGYDHMCVYNADDTEENLKSMFPLGNPYEIGQCARRSLNTFVNALIGDSSGETTVNGATPTGASTQVAALSSSGDVFSMAFIASDNLMASLQMNMTLGIPHSIVSPQGCHIEMDPSKQCHLFTAAQWFHLALSDVLVTQAGIPSSFSRYAGIYGLKKDPFRNGQDCDAAYHSMEYCRKPISNWFC
jgi:hypothetical protein